MSAGARPPVEPHGGDLDAWAARLGCAVDELIDFSICLNPYGPPRAAIRAARDSLTRWSGRYPAPEADGVCDALARFHGIDRESIVAGAGASDLLWRIARHRAGARAIVLGPTFSEYARATLAASGTVEHLPLTLDPERAPPADLVWLCQPNSPGGEHHETSALARWIGWAQERGALLVIDESFAELSWPPVATMVQRACVESGVVVVRSLTKTYACPWLRMGYAVSDPALARRLVAGAPPWTMSGAAQAFVTTALQVPDYLERSRRVVAHRRAQVSRALAAAGHAVLPSRGPYVAADVPGRGGARALQETLARDHRIIVRHCGSFVGLERAERLRWGLRSAAEVGMLARVFAVRD